MKRLEKDLHDKLLTEAWPYLSAHQRKMLGMAEIRVGLEDPRRLILRVRGAGLSGECRIDFVSYLERGAEHVADCLKGCMGKHAVPPEQREKKGNK